MSPARRWGLLTPVMLIALAGCGGYPGATDRTPAPSAATSSAPAESLIQQAAHSCAVTGSRYSTIGDAGHTITLEGAPKNKSSGLSLTEIVCVLDALSVPDSVVSQMDATRALDGMQRASWDKISATWTYHPDNGFRVILTESK
ncbi:hypothetical protein [Pseudarthrobacter sp. NPDC080039]|uniref:hypothetical protein n=1 Tax=unclassified Pseudarthrobacter TaxID=2647000 RepID=UPI00344C9F96